MRRWEIGDRVRLRSRNKGGSEISNSDADLGGVTGTVVAHVTTNGTGPWVQVKLDEPVEINGKTMGEVAANIESWEAA